MAKKRHLRVLFIGNSHTYYHGLPEWFARMASVDGYECNVTMLAHPGWYLHQHVKEPEVRFNIEYGHYDYVVLQEHSHPFDDIPGYIEAATTLAGWIREAGSTPVIYGTWSRKTEKHSEIIVEDDGVGFHDNGGDSPLMHVEVDAAQHKRHILVVAEPKIFR